MGTDEMRTIALVVHIASGGLAVAVAAVVMIRGSRQDWGTRWGASYVGLVLVVAVSAVALVGLGSTLPTPIQVVLVVIAVATAVVAVLGFWLARRRLTRPEVSRPTQLRLMWGSLTSLVSAIAVVSTPVFVWVPVIVIGTVLTERGHRRARLDPAWRLPVGPA